MKRNIIIAIVISIIGMLSGEAVVFYHFFYPEQYAQSENGEYIHVGSAKQSTFPVNKNTKFKIEYYYPQEEKLLVEDIESIPELIGCSQEEVNEYLQEYMQHLSYDEQEDGLSQFELKGYSGNEITLRKTFSKEEKKGYYAKSFNGTIVILNGDEKTVYEYTGIPINILPENLKRTIIQGYYLESDEELYSFLENYSS